MEHKLKILPQYFKSSKDGTKPFEIRENDRGFKVGDTLLLQEYTLLEEYGVETYTGQEITKEVTYILEGGQYGLEEGYCILGLKQQGIVLKNIDLTGINVNEQHKKVIEEMNELFDAIEIGTKENVIDEYLDVIQSWLGYIFKRRDIKAEEVQAYYSTWVKKLENRPRQKKCSKCIERVTCASYMYDKDDNSAKDCRTYKEQEE